MAAVFLLFLMLVGSTPLNAVQEPQKAFVGCLNRLPDGTLQFGAVPSGELFILSGSTNLAEEHVNQLVRVFGNLKRDGSNNGTPAMLTVERVQALAASCTSVLPSKTFEEVPGKVGEDAVAVPLTDTSSEDRTTPGFQTQAATAQSSGAQSAFSSHSVELPAAPPHPEQVGQSEAAANVNARSVERTEILPGLALGVTGSETESEPVPAASQPSGGPSAQSNPGPVVVTISGKAVPFLSPPKVRIKTGQMVVWLNSTGTMQEIIANPARETQLSSATIPTNVKPFDSGFVRPDHSFQYQFSVPGTYRYLCKVGNLNNSTQVLGEVDVE
jgi:plastocyanin